MLNNPAVTFKRPTARPQAETGVALLAMIAVGGAMLASLLYVTGYTVSELSYFLH